MLVIAKVRALPKRKLRNVGTHVVLWSTSSPSTECTAGVPIGGSETFIAFWTTLCIDGPAEMLMSDACRMRLSALLEFGRLQA